MPSNEVTPVLPTCPSQTIQPNPTVGDPIIILDGANTQSVTDYRSEDGRFQLNRAYRSFPAVAGLNAIYGPVVGSAEGWRFGFEVEVHVASDGSGATVHLPEGTAYNFTRSGNSFQPTTGSTLQTQYTLSFVGAPPSDWTTVVNATTTWHLTDTAKNQVWTLQTFNSPVNSYTPVYNIARPLKMTQAAGYTWTYSYDSFGTLRSIIDSYGRTFGFIWNYYPYPSNDPSTNAFYYKSVPATISQISLPGGGKLRYTYNPPVDSNGASTELNFLQLVRAELDDASGAVIDFTTYQYANATYPDLLTSITDASGTVRATFTYDARGRALSVQDPNGQNLYSIAFAAAATSLPNELVRTVTNPLNKNAEYHWAHPANANLSQLTSVLGIASPNCPASASAYSYDANSFVASETDAEARVTAYVRDSLARPTSITRGSGTPQAVTTTVAWDTTYSVPVQIVEPGVTTTQTVDPSTGLVTQVQETDTTTQTVPYSTNGQTRTWTYTYDSTGRLATVVGPGSSTPTIYTYDPAGFLKSVTDALGQVTYVTSANARGQPTSITDPKGIATNLTYDGHGWLTTVSVDTAHTPATTSVAYDAVGDVTSITDPIGSTQTFTYDSARRLLTVTNTAGDVVTYTRDAMGNATSVTVTNSGGTTTYSKSRTFDELGRLIKSIGAVPANSSYQFGYDRTDNLTSVTDPRSYVFSYGFDALNRLIQETNEEHATVTLTRNGIDAITAYQDPRSITTTYVRNGFGDIIQESSPDKGTTVYYRDGNGNLTQRSDPRGSVPSISDLPISDHRTYDTKGNVTSYSRTISTVPTFTSTYAYDLDGNVTSMTYPSGRIVTFQRDGLGRISGVTTQQFSPAASQTVASSVSWLPFSGVASFTFGNGIFQAFSRDTDNRITSVVATTPASANVVNRSLSWTGNTLDSIIDNQFPGNTPPFTYSAQSQSFTYTPAHRLSGATGYYGTHAWTYDPTGNRTQDTTNGVVSTYAYPTTSNQLISITPAGGAARVFTYDAAGNLTTDSASGSPALTFVYDAEGRLAKAYQTATPADGGTYAYDTDSRLSARTVTQTASPTTVTTYYAYNTKDHIVAELNGSGQTLREYIWLDDMPLAVVDNVSTSPVIYFVQVDHLMRPARMTDANVNWVWDVIFDPFGAVAYINQNPAKMDIRFPGQWFQLETGLAYNWHRHYDATTGRYVQPDPLVDVDNRPTINGVPVDQVRGYSVATSMGWLDPKNAATFSPLWRSFQGAQSIYGYGEQSPLAMIDPSGMQTLPFPVPPSALAACLADPPCAAALAGATIVLYICERRTARSPGGGAGSPYQRCLNAAGGAPEDWGAFCGSIPFGEQNNVVGGGSARLACERHQFSSPTEKRNWCENQYGNH